MKARILSAVLAILMILAVCPVITLSAAESNVSVWDGTVAGVTDGNGKGVSLKQMQMECHAAGGPKATGYTPYTTTRDAVKEHLDTTTWNIKSAAGLALFSAWSNGYVFFSDWTGTNGNFVTCFGGAWNATIKLTVDIDLNNHFWIPISAYYREDNTPQAWFTFEGQNHTIRNMNIQETADPAKDYQCFGLFGAIYMPNKINTIIKTLAILDATIQVTQPATVDVEKKHNIYVGGLVGLVDSSGTSASFKSASCIIDADIKVTTNGKLSQNKAEATMVSVDDNRYQGGVGGYIGYFTNKEYTILIAEFVVNGEIEIKKTNATDTDIAVGGVFSSHQTVTMNAYNSLVNVAIKGDFPFAESTQVPYYALYANLDKFNQKGLNTGVEIGQSFGGTTLLNSETKANVLAGKINLITETKWKAHTENKYPLPTAYQESYDTVESYLRNTKANPLFNIMGTGVRIKPTDTEGKGQTGLRFSIEINQAILKDYVETYGVVVARQGEFTGTLDVNTEKALNVVVPAGGIYESTSAYAKADQWIFGNTSKQMNVALLNIPEANFSENLCVRAYVKLQDGTYVYSDVSARNLKDVIENVMKGDNVADKEAVYNCYNGYREFLGDEFKAYTPVA